MIETNFWLIDTKYNKDYLSVQSWFYYFSQDEWDYIAIRLIGDKYETRCGNTPNSLLFEIAGTGNL